MKLGGCDNLYQGQMLLVLKAVYPGPLCLQIGNKKAAWWILGMCLTDVCDLMLGHPLSSPYLIVMTN